MLNYQSTRLWIFNKIEKRRCKNKDRERSKQTFNYMIYHLIKENSQSVTLYCHENKREKEEEEISDI